MKTSMVMNFNVDEVKALAVAQQCIDETYETNGAAAVAADHPHRKVLASMTSVGASITMEKIVEARSVLVELCNRLSEQCYEQYWVDRLDAVDGTPTHPAVQALIGSSRGRFRDACIAFSLIDQACDLPRHQGHRPSGAALRIAAYYSSSQIRRLDDNRARQRVSENA